MSDLRINISFSNDTAGTITATKKRKLKNKLRKKRQELQQHRYLGSKQKHNRGQSSYGQTSLYNGASTEHPTPTQNKSLPQTGATTSASQCTLPSWAFTVISKGGHEKPKEPANTKSATATTHCSSALTSHKSTTTTGSSASSSHKPTVTPGFSVLSSHKPITPSGFSTPSSHKPTSTSAAVPTKYLAIDCEMVGTGPKGHVSQLARCSLVSYNGEIVYDKFIKPTELVTDYRTRWSGIRRSDLVNAMPYSQARKEILRLLNGKVVIGHAIHNDFKVLSYSHPAALTRDTSRIPLLNRKAGFAENECASLKRLTKAIFNRDIQNGKKGHSSVEDAKATMELYKVVEQEWERSLASKSQAC